MNNRVAIMREATVRIVKMIAEKDVKVTQRGARAFVEYAPSGRPVRVNIPYIPDDATEELLDATQGFIDHEVAHILFTDYKVLAEAKRKGVAKLHNIIEDSYIERRMTAHFTGSGLNLRNVGSFFLKTHTDKELRNKPENAEGILFVPAVRSWAGQTVFTDYMGDKWHYMSDLVTKLGDATKEVAKCASSRDCLAVALKFKELLDVRREPEPVPKTEPEPPKMEDGGSKGESKDKGKPGKKPKEAPEDELKPEGDEPEEKSDEEPKAGGIDLSDDEAPPDDEVTPDTEPPLDEGDEEFREGEEEKEKSPTSGDDGGSSVEDIKEKDAGASPEVDKVGEEEGEGGSGDIPDEGGSEGVDDEVAEPEPTGPTMMEELEDKMGEKDYDAAISEALTGKTVAESKSSDYLVYTKELDVIEPMEVSSHRGYWNDSLLKTMQDQVDHMIGPLQKDLERAVAARSAATWSGGHRSGRLHSSSLARLAVGDDRVFRRKHVNDSKDVAVELLVDCSGSMQGKKIEIAAYTAYGLAMVLDRMGIPNEVLGFTTSEYMPAEMKKEASELGVRYARDMNLYIPILKGFNERLTSENKKRFAALPHVSWLSENVDGESVQIAAQRLSQRREKRKILMVLSDGQPSCPGDYSALKRHLKKSVQDVVRRGIDVIGIGILSEAPREYYPKYVFLNNVADLPTTVIGEIKRLLMS